MHSYIYIYIYISLSLSLSLSVSIPNILKSPLPGFIHHISQGHVGVVLRVEGALHAFAAGQFQHQPHRVVAAVAVLAVGRLAEELLGGGHVSFVLEHRDLGNGSTKDPSIYIYMEYYGISPLIGFYRGYIWLYYILYMDYKHYKPRILSGMHIQTGKMRRWEHGGSSRSHYRFEY